MSKVPYDMSDEILNLVQQGLYQENLQKLITLCNALFDESPCMYGSLIYMFDSLAQEYDNQAISVSRYNLVLIEFQPAILKLLEPQDDASLIHNLNELYKTFASLKASQR
jgi:hypothetical protein